MPTARTPPIYTSPQDAALAFYQAFEAKDIDAMMTAWADDEEIVALHRAGAIGFVFGWQIIRLSKMHKPKPLGDAVALDGLTRCMGEAEKNRNDKFFETLLAKDLTFRRANGAIVSQSAIISGTSATVSASLGISTHA